MVYWPEFLATDPEVRISIQALPDFVREVGLERGPLSLVSTTEQLLERKSSTTVGIRCVDYAKVGTNFADKRRLLGLCSSLAD
jgi:hypothetical protein